jgi:Fe-S-cluster containining protein
MPDASAEAPASTAKAQFSLPVQGAVLRGTVQVPAGKTTLTELLPIIQNLGNVIIDTVSSQAQAAGRQISCKAGCGACCRQMVPLSIFEAEALTEWLRSLPAERQAELAERFHRALCALRDAGMIDRIIESEWVIEEAPMTQLAIDYFHAGVACPFLENERCSIHPIRPLACREYLVMSSPELCKDPAANEVAGVQLPVKLSRALHYFGRTLTGDPRGWIPLVFLMAWAKGDARPGDHVTGTGEELLQGFLDKAAALAAELEKDEEN